MKTFVTLLAGAILAASAPGLGGLGAMRRVAAIPMSWAIEQRMDSASGDRSSAWIPRAVTEAAWWSRWAPT